MSLFGWPLTILGIHPSKDADSGSPIPPLKEFGVFLVHPDDLRQVLDAEVGERHAWPSPMP